VVLDDKELRNLPTFDRDPVGTLSRFSTRRHSAAAAQHTLRILALAPL
jgi:hypothetical protein